jgi:hypothetical protein
MDCRIQIGAGGRQPNALALLLFRGALTFRGARNGEGAPDARLLFFRM